MMETRVLPLVLAAAVAAGPCGCASTDDVDLGDGDDVPGDMLPDSPLDGVDVPGDVTGDDAGGCTSSDPYCSSDLTQVIRCDPETGAVTLVEACVGDTVCTDGECVDVVCRPFLGRCVDASTLEVCRGNGSGWDTLTCAAPDECCESVGDCRDPEFCPTIIEPVACQIRVFILLDASGSMLEYSRWDNAHTAISTFLTHPDVLDRGIEFGFGTFPPPPPAGDCVDTGFTVFPVPTATTTLIEDHFATYSPRAKTPLVQAMSYMLGDRTPNIIVDPADPEIYNAIILVSDGGDTCQPCTIPCDPVEYETDNANSLALTTQRLRDWYQIRSYAIGFGVDSISEMELNAVAFNGGTSISSYIPADDLTQLVAAFDAILDDMEHCDDIVIN